MPRLARFAWVVLFGNVAITLWGAFVRATGSGAGCGGHWPLCNGDVVPRSPSVATLIEISHRATSGIGFAAVMLLGGLVLRATAKGHPSRVPAVAAMALMLTEVLIGGLIVVLGHVALDPSLVHGVFTGLHAGVTFLLLTALTLTAHHLAGCPAARLRGRGDVVLPLAQAFAGLALTVGSGAVAALGDTLFPATSLRDGFEQDLSASSHAFLHVRTLHPVLALLAFMLVVGACTSLRAREGASPETRALAGRALILVCAQMALGGVNLLLLVPIATQMLHLLLADLLFVALVMLGARALSDGEGASTEVAAVPVATV